jgi:uncharacterized protein with GYD domain
MAIFVTLVRFTEHGLQGIKDGPSRLEQAREDYRAVGAELKEFYLTLGSYDAIAIIEAPDAETIAKMSLRIGARGNSRSETLRAFSEAEYREIIASL